MKRLTLIAIGSLLAATSVLRASQDPPPGSAPAARVDLSGVHDFDFQFGEWRVHHRALRGGKWVEFEGTCNARAVMGGQGNVEDNLIDAPAGAYRAVGLRSYDATTGQWAIWWLDGRFAHGPLDPPVKGHFEHGVGDFFSDDVLNGKPIRVRYRWSEITANSARWEQSYSSDAGKTWESNWVMEFRRVP